MSYAPKVEGYEQTVDARVDYISSGKFVPVGDPEKAAKVMVELAEHPEPPIHLVLGSEAAGLLKAADEARKAEYEKWLPVTISTDHDEADDFLNSDFGKSITVQKG
jgi:hypothetical protein